MAGGPSGRAMGLTLSRPTFGHILDRLDLAAVMIDSKVPFCFLDCAPPASQLLVAAPALVESAHSPEV
jgi:hypothetical protein